MAMIRIFFILCLAGLTGCGGALISSTQELQIGKGVDKQLKKEFSLVDSNDPVSKWAKELVRPLIKASAPFRDPSEVDGYRVEVIANDKLVNAFAAPGGFTYLSTGLILGARDCAEIVGVMGHELAHVTQRHGAKSIEKAFAVQTIIGFFLEDGLGADAALLIFQFLQNTKFSRTDETEADAVGLQISHGAGYDPNGLADFFQVLLNGSKGSTIEFFSSHPATKKRIAAVKQQIKQRYGSKSKKKLSRQCRTKMTLAEVKQHIKSGQMRVIKASGVSQKARANALQRLKKMRKKTTVRKAQATESK